MLTSSANDQDYEGCLRLQQQLHAAQRAQIEAEMQQASIAGDFEKCIRLREQLKSL